MGFQALAKQCSDPSAIETLMNIVFSIANGSEGKLTVNAQKISVLQTTGDISNNAVSSAMFKNLNSKVVTHFVKVLESEGYDGALCTALNSLAMWAKKFREVPQNFLDWIPKGMALKTSNSQVRSAYLHCVLAAMSNGNAETFKPLGSVFNKAIEAASKQATQWTLVAEGANAAACLAKMNTDDQEFWKIINEGQLFVNDRFLLSASPETLQSLVIIAENVIMDSSFVSSANIKKWHFVLALALISDKSETNKAARTAAKKLTSMLGGHKITLLILNELDNLIWHENVQLARDNDTGGGAPGESLASGTTVKPPMVVSAILWLTSCAKFDTNDGRDIALALVLPVHAVSFAHKGLWNKAVKNLGVDPQSAIAHKADDILSLLMTSLNADNRGSVPCVAMAELSNVNPKVLVPKIVELSLNKMIDSSLLVSFDEYQTYLTKEGELFDKSLLESFKKSDDVTNIKRENKAYSYKEQMEELALRKEIEEKKRREGKWVEPKLTPKQKELVAQQLEKESAVRKRLSELIKGVSPLVRLLLASVKGCPKAFAPVIGKGDFLPVILKSLASPLVADTLMEIIKELRLAVFDSDSETLAQTISAMLIQISKPASLAFTAIKDLKTSLGKCLSLLHKSSVPGKDSAEDACPFPTPTFNFSFPVLRSALLKYIADTEVVDQGLQVIMEHAALRGTDETEDIDEYHPKYLPTSDIIKLLIEVISMTEGTVQQIAVSAVGEICQAIDGDMGCAVASQADYGILLDGLQMEVVSVRDACLRGLQILTSRDQGTKSDHLIHRAWVAKFDIVPENRLLADQLWDAANFECYSSLSQDLLEDVVHPVGCVRWAGAEALAASLQDKGSDLTGQILSQLLDLYSEKLEMSPPVIDDLGRVVEKQLDHWEPRSGVAISLAKIAPKLTNDMVSKVVTFFVQDGLGDREAEVRSKMLDAALVAVNLHGKDAAEDLLPVFEDFLENAPKSEKYDNVRQAVVILMGSLAKHLQTTDPKVRPIMRQLIIALKTPSQPVQEAVANCLPPLVPAIKDEAPDIVNQLIGTLLGNKSFGERKGAAYGIAGLVKGLGILSLKQLDIMGKLTEAITNKKNPTHREGALLAFEMLCNMLGRLFEPYIVHILPHLLLCFGDQVEYVRQAADDTARAVMSKLSAHGVKLVLPALLNALEEDQWRTKTGSVELLGAMAFCAPKQLSSCLPSIVPKLIEVLSDSHHKVQAAGVQALKQIGSVIRNPEIQAIVPVLLKALRDPSQKTGPCLQTLLDTKFVHFIDAPSLALIMPVVQRAFQVNLLRIHFYYIFSSHLKNSGNGKAIFKKERMENFDVIFQVLALINIAWSTIGPKDNPKWTRNAVLSMLVLFLNLKLPINKSLVATLATVGSILQVVMVGMVVESLVDLFKKQSKPSASLLCALPSCDVFQDNSWIWVVCSVLGLGFALFSDDPSKLLGCCRAFLYRFGMVEAVVFAGSVGYIMYIKLKPSPNKVITTTCSSTVCCNDDGCCKTTVCSSTCTSSCIPCLPRKECKVYRLFAQ